MVVLCLYLLQETDSRGQYTSGHKHAPTMILEAVDTHDLWIWHSYFGVAGANNDISVLNHSPLFV